MNMNVKCYSVFCIIYCSVLVAISAAEYESRIVGGAPARLGQFPFAVAIHRRTSDGVFFCGGTLISNSYVVTTGTCVYNALSFTLFLGTTNRNSSEPNSKVIAASRYIIHPDYNYLTLENDIGLIQTNLPIEFTDYIQAIYLTTDEVPDYTVVTAIGWGQISENVSGLSDHLNHVEVSTLTFDECNDFYLGIIKPSMLCVAGNVNEGTCRGDTGSPLIYYVNSRHATLAGISSFISRNGCEQGPSGYTRAFPYNDWIRKVTGII